VWAQAAIGAAVALGAVLVIVGWLLLGGDELRLFVRFGEESRSGRWEFDFGRILG
jgi:hypothetical protein